MTDMTGYHPNIIIKITGFEPGVDARNIEKYPLGMQLAHVPPITGIKYRMIFLDNWTPQEEREQIMCPACHQNASIHEGDYTVGKRGLAPIVS